MPNVFVGLVYSQYILGTIWGRNWCWYRISGGLHVWYLKFFYWKAWSLRFLKVCLFDFCKNIFLDTSMKICWEFTMHVMFQELNHKNSLQIPPYRSLLDFIHFEKTKNMSSRRKKDNMTQGFQNLTEHFFNLPKLFRMKKTDSPVQFYLIYGKFEITSVLSFSRLDIIDMFSSFLYLL